MYHDLSTLSHHDWPVEKAMANLPIRLKGNSKHIPVMLSPLGNQKKNNNQRCFVDVMNHGWITSAMQAIPNHHLNLMVCSIK